MIARRRSHITTYDFSVALNAFFSRRPPPSLIADLEQAFASYAGSRHAIAVGSGRLGMRLILQSLKLQPQDEVIIPAYTLKDLIAIIQGLGLKAVPADIEPRSFNIDPASVEKRIGSRTKVIMAAHIFGNPCSMERLREIARRNSLALLEDCAHAAGSKINGKSVGTFSDASFFSFETIKPVNAYGGGMILTDKDEIAAEIRDTLRSTLSPGAFPYKKLFAAWCENLFLPTPFSFPAFYLLSLPSTSKLMYSFYRKSQRICSRSQGLNPYQAAIAVRKLACLEQRVLRRREKAEALKRVLPPQVLAQRINEGDFANYYFFVALLPCDAARVRRELLRYGVDAGIGSEIADDCAEALGYSDCPVMKDVFSRAIQLPLYEKISFPQLSRIAAALKGSLQR